MVLIGLVSSIYDSTEVAIQKMIEASQRMTTMSSQGETGGINPPIKRHLELEIRILQNAPRDSDKLERLLKVKTERRRSYAHRRYTKVSYRDWDAQSCTVFGMSKYKGEENKLARKEGTATGK
jgi:hypothetical protein